MLFVEDDFKRRSRLSFDNGTGKGHGRKWGQVNSTKAYITDVEISSWILNGYYFGDLIFIFIAV
jgi:hypothetical protein